jgi:hypothetical protein
MHIVAPSEARRELRIAEFHGYIGEWIVLFFYNFQVLPYGSFHRITQQLPLRQRRFNRGGLPNMLGDIRNWDALILCGGFMTQLLRVSASRLQLAVLVPAMTPRVGNFIVTTVLDLVHEPLHMTVDTWEERRKLNLIIIFGVMNARKLLTCITYLLTYLLIGIGSLVIR